MVFYKIYKKIIKDIDKLEIKTEQVKTKKLIKEGK
jgi:hypothetical protein